MPSRNRSAATAAGGRARGRPADDRELKPQILAAARREFGERGYDRATLRGIAADVGVDASLISHYFGSKAQLYAAAVEPPYDPTLIFPRLLAGDPAQVGERVAGFIVKMIETDATRRMMLGAVRAAGSEPQAARILRDTLSAKVIGPLAEQLNTDQPQLRASLLSSQLVGIVMARYVVGLEPLASLSTAGLTNALAPAIQHYLLGDLGDPDS